MRVRQNEAMTEIVEVAESGGRIVAHLCKGLVDKA